MHCPKSVRGPNHLRVQNGDDITLQLARIIPQPISPKRRARFRSKPEGTGQELFGGPQYGQVANEARSTSSPAWPGPGTPLTKLTCRYDEPMFSIVGHDLSYRQGYLDVQRYSGTRTSTVGFTSTVGRKVIAASPLASVYAKHERQDQCTACQSVAANWA